MLRKSTDLERFVIAATDGTVGHIEDFYFDDGAWVIRYLVVGTGTWLSSRKVLISPIAVGHPDWAAKLLPVSITKEQVKNCPDIDTNKPVSRYHESQYLEHYGYPYYWVGTGIWGQGAYPSMMLPGFTPTVQAQRLRMEHVQARAEVRRLQDSDPHLRSYNEVMKYHIHATDGDIGHVRAMLLDEKTWAIRYLIVDTSNWWLGHQVLVAPQWIQNVSWPDAKVSVGLTREAVKSPPPYEPAEQLDREQEAGIYTHYRRTGYWADEAIRETAASRQ
jgi:hypothetical protein